VADVNRVVQEADTGWNEAPRHRARADLNYGKIGFIDREGHVVVEPAYDIAGKFGAAGLAPVALATDPYHPTWGYIDSKGKIVVKLKYLAASEFGNNGLAVVVDSDMQLQLVALNGRPIESSKISGFKAYPGFLAPGEPLEFSGGLLAAWIENRWGYLNESGVWQVKPQFEAAQKFSTTGFAAVEQDEKWGYIDRRGKWLSIPQFDEATQFSSFGFAAVRKGKLWGYIDNKGRIAIQPSFDFAGPFTADGLAIAAHDGKKGFIDAQGRFRIPPMFVNLASFGDHAPAGFARASGNPDSEGLIDVKGAYVSRPINCCILAFRLSAAGDADAERDLLAEKTKLVRGGFSRNGLRPVMISGRDGVKWGYINAKGETAIEPRFDYAGDFAPSGLARVLTGVPLRFRYIHSDGTFVSKSAYECAYDFANDGLARVEENGKWKFIDTHGRVTVMSRYPLLSDFSATGFAMISLNSPKCTDSYA
jgi:hypothetical protein